MKQIYFIFLPLIFVFSLQSQSLTTPQNQSHSCGFDRIHQERLLNDPAYKHRTDEFNEMMLNFSMPKSGAQYQVPVVVHVLHKGEAIGTGTNISDEAVQNGIKWLNEYWRKVAGTNGDGGGVDMTIEFALAVRDPSGNCTNGILRRDLSGNAAYVSCGVNFPGSPGCGITDLEAKSGRWPTSQYYNIYLVDKIDNANCFTGGSYTAGYAYFASSHGNNNDGTVALTCSYISPTSTTLAHELGHALNLYHTFEDNTSSCTVETNCATQGDRCCDTQPHRQTDCGASGCAGSGTLLNSTKNYMSYCGNTDLFTADQRTRSIAALTTQRPSFLASNGNMSLVPPGSATVDFTASATAVCVGSSVSFSDKSFCIPNTYTTTGYPNHTFSWTFSGPVTLTSSEQSPSITFNTIGTYDVTLSITNSQGTFTETKYSYLEVTSAPVAACTPTSFNNCNCSFSVNNVSFNTINNSTSTTTNVAYTDFSCSHSTIVEPGETYPISITIRAGNTYLKYFEVYIDYNNDGIFQAGEKVFEGNSGATNTTVTRSGNIVIPTTAVENTLLRMRVMGEASNPPSADKRACTTQYFVGDVEDYGVFIKPTCTPPAQPGAISGNVSVCENSTQSYSITAVADATSYTWSVPADATINSGQGSTGISVTFGAAGGNISVTANNACGPGAGRSQAITIATPNITSTTPGSRCGTGSVLLEASASAGTISWFANLSGGVALGTGNTFNTPSISTTTTYYIEANNGGCISSPRVAVDATVNNIPIQANLTLPLDASINVNVSPTFTWDAVAGATGYDIQIATDVDFTNIVNSTTSVTNSYTQTPALSPNSSYYWRVRATNSCGNGAYSSVFSFTTENFICNTYASTNVPIVIPSASAATVTSTLNITDNITIDKLNVSNLVGTHTYISDLIVSLTSPAGTSVILFSQICTTQDDFNVKFDDDAPSATLPCPPIDGNYYRPNQPLSAFNGETSQGIWTLTIQDVFAADGGSLNAWSLYVCGTACTAPAAPTGLACYESASFNNTTCVWDVTGTQPAAPTGLACYESASFNNTTCVWDVTGTQPAAPTGLACYESASFNNTTCVWDVTGTQPAAPTGLACYESASFNNTTCVWDVTGTQPAAPSGLACYESASFNNTTCVWDVTGTQPAAPTGLACYESASFNNSTCVWDVTGTQPAAPTGLACYESASFNNTTCVWDVTGTQPAAPSGLACYESASFNNTTCVWDVTGTQPAAPTGLACYESASFNNSTCVWDVTGTQPAAPTGLACYESASFNNSTCVWDVTGTQPAAPTGLACYESASFNNSTCVWDVTGTQPAAPTGLACYESASFNNSTCVWDVTGTQPAAPTGLACYESASFNNSTCVWDVTGTQPAAPTGLACYESASFNNTTCVWDVTGTQPAAPTGLACYESASFNNSTCVWDVTGTQPAAPTGLACYESASFNNSTCVWDVTGTQPAAPTGLACYESASFNNSTCVWDVTGTQPAAPTGLACYESASFNNSTCVWDVTGTQPAAPTGLACYESASFNNSTCVWDVTGTQPAAPTGLACYESASFNNSTCVWDVMGTQPAAPTGLACYESASFNNTTCVWDVTGTQPAAPTGLACYESASFNNTTCVWDVTGTQPVAPTGLACYESASFNNTTCVWDVTGTQPVAPTGLACYESASFNNTTCVWDVTGTQPVAPTGLACYESASFNNTTCVWDVTGTQPAAPTGLACYESASFNNSTCVWDVTGTQPAAPTGLACYESASFNNSTCVWDVTGTQPAAPTGLACYESASFNNSTCVWDVMGTQPAAPTGLACYESASFNNTTCVWDVTGTQPAAPTGLACYESASFNNSTCVWDVTGTQPLDEIDTRIACDSITWIDGITYTISTNAPTFTIVGGASNGCDSIVLLNLTINNSSSVTLNEQICDGDTITIGGQNFSTSGVYQVILTNAAGCDSIVSLNLIISTPINTSEALTSCDPADVGSFTNTFTNQFGCDSVHTRNVTLSPSDNTSEALTSCDPADVGSFANTFTNQFGCDSVHTRNVTLSPSDNTSEALTSCDPADVGSFANTFTNQFGCDSVHTRNVTLSPSDNTSEALTSCDPADVGSFANTFTNQFGCDSVHTRNITLSPSDNTSEALTSCDPADVGSFTNTFTNQFGCDSVHTRNVTLSPSDNTSEALTSCDPADVGSFANTFTNQFGCDSVHTRNITLSPSDNTSEALTSCDPADVGSFTNTFTNQFGCDSVHTRNVTLSPSDNTSEALTSCDPADVGSFTNTFTNQFGCDSVHTRNVTLSPSDNTSEALTSCDPADVGSFANTFTNQFGCDSVHTRNVTLSPSDNTSEALTSCDPADVGSFTNTFTNQFGCDSVHTRNVTLSPLANTPGAISGNTEVCQGSTHNYNINSVPDALVYLWSIPADATLISGQGSTSITVQFGISGGVIGVTANNNCGNSAQQILAVNVSTNQAPTVNIVSATGNTTICYGTDVEFFAFYSFGGNTPDFDWQVNGISTGINSDAFTGSNLSNGDVVSCVITSSNVCATPQSASSNSIVMNVTELNEDVDTTGNILAAIETGASYRWFDCDNNTFISGETGQSFTPVASGNYSVEITKNNCSVISDCYEIEISTQVSIKEIDFNQIKLYPNPNNGIFYIEFDKVVNELNVTITDAIGKIIYMDDFKNTGKISMNIEPASGIYFLKLRSASGEMEVIKFTIY
jgi:subtilisin-like proprotein convertase family protein